MSEDDNQEINRTVDLEKNKSKTITIDIPLVVRGDNKPEVKPKKNSIRNEDQNDQTAGQEGEQGSGDKQGDDQTAGQEGEQGSGDKQGDDQTGSKSSLSPVGEMNRRRDKNSGDAKTDKENKNNDDSKENPKTGGTKGQSLRSSWNKLRNSIARKKRKNKDNESNSVNKTSRLASFEFYRLCWLNLIDTFGLTYFGLLFLYIAKYMAHNPKIIKFVSLKDPTVRSKIIKNKEKTSFLMILAFAALSVLVAVVILINVIFLVLFIKAMNASLWGLINGTAWDDLKFFWGLVKDLIFN